MLPATTVRRPLVALLGAGVLTTTGCGGGDRPSGTAWTVTWSVERGEFPDADTFAAGGQDLCDSLVGRLRSSLTTLTPTPDEALDGAVAAWVRTAERLAFDCPDARDELDRRHEQLAVFAAEIDAGLAAAED